MNIADPSLTKARRQSPVAMLFMALKFLRSSLKTFWPLILIWLFNSGKGGDMMIGKLVLVIGGLNLVASLVAYFKYYFYVKDGELVIEHGILTKKKLNIPFERIQTINFEQNVLHRMLKVVKVQVDTAGSSASELTLQALDLPTAEALRAFVLQEKAQAVIDSGELDPSTQPVKTQSNKELLFRRSPYHVWLIGLTQNHLRLGAAVVIGGLYGLSRLWSDITGVDLSDWLIQNADKIPVHSQFYWLLGILLFMLASLTVSVSTSFINYYGLSVWKTREGFNISSGLLNRKEQAVRLAKLQFIRWSINPLQALIGISTLRLYQASSTQINVKKAMSIPGSSPENIDQILQESFPTEADSTAYEGYISPLIVGHRLLFGGILPALILVPLSALFIKCYALLWLLLIPMNYFRARRFQHKYRFYIDNQLLKIHSQVIAKSYTLLHLYKVQGVALTQSLYQVRKGLASVALYTAAGTVSIPYVDIQTARNLQNYILYKIESSQQSWM